MSNNRKDDRSRGGRRTRLERQQQPASSDVQQSEGEETSPAATDEPVGTPGRQRGPGGGRMRRKRPRRSSQANATSGFRIPSIAWWAMGGGGIAAIIVFVAIIQGTSGGATTSEHWHARLTVQVCGDAPFMFPSFRGDLHSHGDGQIHIHPKSASQAGDNASLGTFFENAGEEVPGFGISEEHIEIDGKKSSNGDLCNDGNPGQLVVSVNGERLGNFLDYLPQDGDAIAIGFQ